jgi:phosphoribosylamine---glycine ligase
MKILVVGGGGREHALAWKIAQSPLVKKVYCAPGNPGIARHAECVPLRADDLVGILQFVREKSVDLTVVGPEDPLSLGIADELTPKGFKVFGPMRAAAELESSKVFSKHIMQKHGIPTATFRVFQDAHDAHDYVAKVAAPLVVKADGLAKGKGVIVCGTSDEAHEAIRDIMERKIFGKAGDQIIIEECLRGQEASILAISDGRTIVLLEPAQDHKRIGDGDVGPNTGGMGAYSPVPVVTPALRDEVERRVFIPTIHGMRREGRRYQGILYAGIMLTGSGPQVLEFNVRWGDPEAQPILMRMKSDLVPVLMAAAEGTLKESQRIEWDPRPAICVVMASGGYPGDYEKGKPISGLDEAAKLKDVMVFHAGTAMSGGQVVTSGGRVLGVTALGKTIAEARERAYDAIGRIHFDGAQFRSDIGHRAIK